MYASRRRKSSITISPETYPIQEGSETLHSSAHSSQQQPESGRPESGRPEAEEPAVAGVDDLPSSVTMAEVPEGSEAKTEVEPSSKEEKKAE